jgi:hypothetical protein
MNRISLTDDSGRWFNSETAILFKEGSDWNGNNHISRATGSQWEHEWLYYTKGGKWVLHWYSQRQGSLDSYEQIDETQAVAWLVRNERFELDGLPKPIREAVDAAIADAEL